MENPTDSILYWRITVLGDAVNVKIIKLRQMDEEF